MTYRRITFDKAGGILRISSEYNDEIRLAIKSFPGARWDGKGRVWQVPLHHCAELLERLKPYGFEVSDDVPLGDTGGPPARDTLSVGEVNHRIGAALHQGFPGWIWVKGELASFDKSAGRRHWYFELVEKAPGSDEVAARLSVVIFQGSRARIEHRLAAAPEPLSLRDGLEVRLRGRVEFYAPGGRVQLVVDDIDPDFAFGQLARRRREILEALAREELLERNRALPWPALPLRVGLITASHSDAYHDFVRTLQRSPYAFVVMHHPAAVQGAQLEPQMLAALDYFERNAAEIDIVVIVRGGGSRSDLAWFDNLAVARSVATHPTKVLIGIGHERDRSVLDEIAASEKTPTAAAEFLAAAMMDAEENFVRLARRTAERAQWCLGLEQRRLQTSFTRLRALSTTATRRARDQVDRRLAVGLRTAVKSRLSVERARVVSLAARLQPNRVLRGVDRLAIQRTDLERRLRTAVRMRLQSLNQELTLLQTRVAAVDPIRAMARGFAVVHSHTGKLVRSPDQAPLGSSIGVRLHRGGLTAQVTEHHEPNEGD